MKEQTTIAIGKIIEFVYEKVADPSAENVCCAYLRQAHMGKQSRFNGNMVTWFSVLDRGVGPSLLFVYILIVIEKEKSTKMVISKSMVKCFLILLLF